MRGPTRPDRPKTAGRRSGCSVPSFVCLIPLYSLQGPISPNLLLRGVPCIGASNSPRRLRLLRSGSGPDWGPNRPDRPRVPVLKDQNTPKPNPAGG